MLSSWSEQSDKKLRMYVFDQYMRRFPSFGPALDARKGKRRLLCSGSLRKCMMTRFDLISIGLFDSSESGSGRSVAQMTVI